LRGDAEAVDLDADREYALANSEIESAIATSTLLQSQHAHDARRRIKGAAD